MSKTFLSKSTKIAVMAAMVIYLSFGSIMPVNAITDIVKFIPIEPVDPQMSITKTVDKGVASPGDQVTYTLEATNDSTSQNTPLDVMLVIDKSGSMDDDNQYCEDATYLNRTDCENAGFEWIEKPLRDAQDASKSFIDGLNNSQDKVGLVSFSSSATLNQNLSYNYSTVKNSIDALDASGGTRIDRGIDKAYDELAVNGRPDPTKQVMIVLSDGVSGGDPAASAQTAKDAGIRIITIGLGEGVDEDPETDGIQTLLTQLASTPSDFHYAPTSSELAGIYTSILGTLCDEKTLTITDDITDVLVDADLISSNPAVTSQVGNVLSWEFANVGCGETVTASFTVQVKDTAPDGNVMDNDATVTDGEIEVPASKVETAIEVPVVPTPEPTPEPVVPATTPVLSVIKSVDKSLANPSDTLSYTVTVSNSGDGEATNVAIVDTLPAGFTFANDDGTNSGDTERTWTWDSLAAGADITVKYDVLIDSSAGADTYKNVAIASADEVTSVSDNAITVVSIPKVLGETAPSLSISKSVAESFVNPGGTATYTVTVTNTGDAPALNAVLNDVLPTGFVFTDNGATTMSWELGDIVPTETVTKTYTVKVDAATLPGGYVNVATVSADDVNSISAEATLTVKAVEVLGAETDEEATLPVTGGGLGLILGSLMMLGTGAIASIRRKK